MASEQIVTIIVAVIGTLGGGAAWNYYQRRLDKAEAEELRQEKQEHMYRDDLRERVAILETRLDDSLKERDKLMPERGTLSVDKAKKLIGYIPSNPVDIGYVKYINWYKKNYTELLKNL